MKKGSLVAQTTSNTLEQSSLWNSQMRNRERKADKPSGLEARNGNDVDAAERSTMFVSVSSAWL